MRPQGTIIAIGGNEEKEFKGEEKFQPEFGEGAILKSILRQAGGSNAKIEVITTASSIPKVVGHTYERAFDELSAKHVGILHINSGREAENQEVLQRLKNADAVMFSGGDQSRLSRIFTGTQAYGIIHDRYLNEPFVVAGTSAGAMVMSEEMIAGGKHGPTFKKKGLKMGKGLGLMKDVIFDSHFIQRGRFGRLAEAVALHPDKLGIGLGEDTGMIIKEGNICEVIGTGMAILFDGSSFSYNKCESLKSNMPISLGNLTVHILAPHDKYDIQTKNIEVYHNPKYYKGKLSKLQ